MKGPWVKLWRNVFADEVVSFCMRRYGHETAIMWIGILSQADDGVLLMDEDVFADLIQIEENRYRELRGILIKRGLIIENEQGLLEVPNWNEYQTGQSTERARACRERRKDATLRNGCATEKQRVEVEVEVDVEVEEELPAEAETATPGDVSTVETFSPAKGDESKKSIEEGNSLYRAIWESCLAMSGNLFSNYPREGEGCKRLCRLLRARSPTEPEKTAREILELFKRLREAGGNFWAGQPFTPSVLASAAIFDRLWTEHERGRAAGETDWIDRLEEQAV